MLKKALLDRHPMSQLGFEKEDILPAGAFGAVLAHAGVGKTALLVQLALNAMLRTKNVLHVSLNDPVSKITLWYKELFQNLTNRHETPEVKEIWESVLPHRFIMTFRVESFSVPRLEERILELTEQGIFSPEMMIIDGFHFDESRRSDLAALKTLASRYGIPVWFTVHTHRHENSGQDGLPPTFSPIQDLFDILLELQTEHANIHVRLIRGEVSSQIESGKLLLDPSTMLIKDRS